MVIDASLLASAFSAAGAPIWAAIVQGVIQVLKQVAGGVIDGREKLVAFVLSALVVLLAFWAALGLTPPTLAIDPVGIVTLILSWFSIARLAMAFYDDVLGKVKPAVDAPAPGDRVPQSVLSSAGWTGKP